MRLLSIAVAAIALLEMSAMPAAGKPTPRPLDLQLRDRGDVPFAPTVVAGRYVLPRLPVGQLRIEDDRTGLVTERPLPADCGLAALHWPEVLLSCGPTPERSTDATPVRPAMLDLRDGAMTEYEPAPYEPGRYCVAERGYCPTLDRFSDFGREWLEGTYYTAEVHVPYAPVFYNRRTGERRTSGSARRNLDSPDLEVRDDSPVCPGPRPRYTDPAARAWLRHGPRGSIVLERCGRRRMVVCREDCWAGVPVLTRRVVAWAGARSVGVYAISSGRRQRLRFPRFEYRGYSLLVGATDRRLLVTVPRFDQSAHDYRFRLLEARLPESLR